MNNEKNLNFKIISMFIKRCFKKKQMDFEKINEMDQ